MGKGIAGAIIGIVAAVTGAVTGSSDVVNDYAKAKDSSDRADSQRSLNEHSAANSTAPSGQSK